MTLPDSLPTLEDGPFIALIQEAAPIICEELELRFPVRATPGAARAARPGQAENVGRPALVFRATFRSDAGHHVPLGAIVKEREAMVLCGGTVEPETLMRAVFSGLRRALEARTCIAWSEADLEPVSSPVHLCSPADLEAASWPLEINGAASEICLVALPGAMDVYRNLEGGVVIALRPRLVETSLPRLPPGEVHPDVLESIPICVEATLRTERVSVGRVAGLRVGDALRLSDEWARLVRVVVGGKVIATGELVVVGGRWGVLVAEVGGES